MSPTNRRFSVVFLVVTFFLLVFYILSLRPGPYTDGFSGGGSQLVGADGVVPAEILTGHAIAPKLGNETAKKELGNAAWRVLHTTFARFPDKPTKQESQALESYIHLFQRLYPCGECAEHFGQLLKKYPPQTSSRSAAAAWGCHVHNEVNKRLKKELFDCSNIGDFYDCGCADKEEKSGSKGGYGKPEMSMASRERLTGDSGRSLDTRPIEADD